MARMASKPMAIRGVMLDLARLIERHEYYFDLLPLLAKSGINTIWWHFVDDEGFRLQLDGRPELASPFAFTKAEMRHFIEQAAGLGIEVVPEVESLGHAQFITHLPQYAHLADGDATHFNAICASQPQTLKLLGEIITEVADLFPSEYFHAGLDEVNFAGCPRCDRRGRGKPNGHVFVEHAKAIHKIVTGCGKRMIMWADHVEHEPSMLKRLPKDIVLAHWHYNRVRFDQITRSIRAGFKVIGCPSLCHYGDVITPNADNFENMDSMTEFMSSQNPRLALGAVNTWWDSWRGLRDAYLPILVYTGKLLTGGKRAAKEPFLAGFLSEQFGLDSKPAAKALWRSYELAIRRTEMLALLPSSLIGLHDAANLAAGDSFADRAKEMQDCLSTLRQAARKVRRNADEFAAIVLATECAAACLDNGLAIKQVFDILRRAENRSGPKASPAELAKEIALVKAILKLMFKRVANMQQAVDKEWNRTRHNKDAKGYTDILAWPYRQDSILKRLHMCKQYLRSLLADVSQLSPHFQRGSFIWK